MKVAITATGNTMKSELDERFGRCSYLAIHDFDTHLTEFIKNPNKEAEEGAGPATVQLIASKEVTKIISGEFGGKVKKILDDLQIQMIMFNGPTKTIQDIVKLMNNN
ncbi:NifB/NifX family molybdenum-iron cluster-binding protein [Sunxiuqinia sp. A32]|uniref:NifB/NifX family molybdenum-iron cluster-binding protein n=1 Tax=Sunxiuqinia sp. A32 TaxID=3461496 RepID=UPI0040456A95